MRKGLSTRKKAGKTKPLFFGIKAKKKRTKKIRSGFVFSPHLPKVLIIAFYLFAIGGFAFVLDKTLHATGADNISTVDFYANASRLEGADNSWSGSDRVLGKPQAMADGATTDFNSDNSAIYSGGSQSLVCDNFTTADFIKNSAPAIVTSTPQVILENKPADNFATVTSTSSSPAIISSSTVGTQDFAFLPAATSSSENSAVQNVSTPSSDNSSSVQPVVEENQPATDPAPAASTEPAVDNIDSAPAVEEIQNHLPDSAPAPDNPSQPAADSSNQSSPSDSNQPSPDSSNQSSQGGLNQSAENTSGNANSDSPVSWLKELKNIAAVSRQEMSKTLLGQLVQAASKWGSNADDRNILFGPFQSAKIKISLAALKAEINSTSTTGTQNFASLRKATGTQDIAFLPAASSTSDNQVVTNSSIVVWYSFADEAGGNIWRAIGTIDARALANADRGGYLAFAAPFLNDWRDLDGLRLKFEGQAAGGDFRVYLDSVWVEIAYQNGSTKAEEKSKNTDKDKLNVDGREINFLWTDNNNKENLIIKSDRKNYFGLTNAEMYFSVENTGVRDENVNFQFYFPATSSSVVKIDELVPHSPYLTKVPKYEAKVYDCANGWDKRDNFWFCYPTLEQQACDEVSPNRRYCRVNGVMIGVEEKIQYADRWQGIDLGDRSIAPQEGLLQKLLGLGPQLKKVPDNLKSKKTTAAGTSIAPGEVKYFKASLGFPANSAGEFYIEAIGSNDGYGLLDPWWNSGWNYRLPINIDNTGNASTLTDYQLYLEMSSSTSRDFWRHIKSDGSDIRFTDSTQTTELPFWVQSFDSTASSAKIWIKVDSIPANAQSTVYLFYGNSGASSASDQFAPFTYSSLKNIFYTASSSAVKTVNVVSLIDNNQVQLDNGTAVNLNRQQTAIFTGFTSASVIKTKGPIMAKLSGGSALESAIPVSFAGTSFVIPSNRNIENFNVYAPFSAANLSLYDGTSLQQTYALGAGNAWTTTQNIATDSLAILESDQPVLFSFADNGLGDSLLGYPAGNRDLYGVKSQYNLIGANADSSFNIFCSNNSSASISLARGVLQNNQTCSGGTKGAGDAVRLAGINGAINAIQEDEGGSKEAAIFLPFQEFSSEYMLPTNAAHIAVVCAPESGTVNLSIYDENNGFVESGTCAGSGVYPGKAYFGATDATTYLAGSRIVSTNGQPFYAYYKDTAVSGGAETNLFGAVQTRTYSVPNPAYAFGDEQIAGPPTGLINSAAQKNDRSGAVAVSIAVNDLSRDDCRAKIEYGPFTGGHCDFSSPVKAALDPASISASYGAPVVTNSNAYQIGTSTGWISTASGTNNILFNWLSKNDLPTGNGVYCLRLTANDNIGDQTAPATTTVAIDNVVPTQPGNLSLAAKTGTSATLRFSATSSDSNFKEYRIYYKQYDGSPVTENDSFFGSSSDSYLASANLNHATTTTVIGLTAGLKYTFNLFAYDTFGNRASSTTGIDVVANDAPTAAFNSAAEKTDGTGRADISFTVNDVNYDNTVRAKLEYQPGSMCDFSSSQLATIDSNNLTATFGTVHRDNNQTYRVGTTSYYILTSLGANTINLNWLSALDVAAASGTYCLRLTANDGVDDQIDPAEVVVVLDNVKPIASGNLAIGSSTETTLQLILPIAHPAQDNNEPATAAYKIFYKVGTSGVTPADSPFTSTALNAYDFNGSSSVIVSGLIANTHYVFNIWADDSFGNLVSSTEVTARTDADLTNKSLIFVDSESTGTTTNIAVADNSTAWNFRARVTDVDGYAAINDVTLRLADAADNSSPFGDLQFTWTRSSNSFAETGADVNSAAAISAASASSCADNSCSVDFKIIFAKTFASSSIDYSGELYSTDASARTADDIFANIFQLRKSWVDQKHYRWRNDNGGG